MRRIVVVLVVAACGLLAPADSAKGAFVVVPEDRQALMAGTALWFSANEATTGLINVDGGWCRPLKRSRWRCRETVSVESTTCTTYALVSKRWWRFPPEWFQCPAEWNPSSVPAT